MRHYFEHRILVPNKNEYLKIWNIADNDGVLSGSGLTDLTLGLDSR